MVLRRASVPSRGREAAPELERRPFDQDLRARLETREIDPPNATTRFQHRLKQYYKWTDEFAARTSDSFWRFLRILTLVATLWYFVISDGLSSPELRRRLNQSSAGQGDVFRVGAGLSEHFHSVREGIRRGPISTSSPAAAIPLATRSPCSDRCPASGCGCGPRLAAHSICPKSQFTSAQNPLPTNSPFFSAAGGTAQAAAAALITGNENGTSYFNRGTARLPTIPTSRVKARTR